MEAGRNSSESPIGDESAAAVVVVNLPQEIVIEILTRLPVKPLLKFRCVSKSWRSLISSPSFVESHLQASEKDSSFTNHRIMFTSKEEGEIRPLPKHLSLRSVMEDEQPLVDVSIIDYYPGNQRPYKHKVVGSDNGLICILVDTKDLFLLWNPTTRVLARLPPGKDGGVFHDLVRRYASVTVYGFGYCKASDDYKVLFIFYMIGRNGLGVVDSFVKIYSQKADSWKIMEGYNYKNNMFPLLRSGKLVNGKLHFAMRSVLKPAPVEGVWYDIVYIDLDSETDGIIGQPDYGKGRLTVKQSKLDLGVLSGFLCILFNPCINPQGDSSDLWVLKEYGVKESWSKLFTIRHMDVVRDLKSVELTPLIILPTGEILFLFAVDAEPDGSGICRLAIYNPKDNTWTYPEITHLINSTVIYIESLVSPLLNIN